MIKDIIYQERRFPLRTVQDIHGIYLVSSKELEESLIEGVRNLDAAANELLDGTVFHRINTVPSIAAS